MTSGQPSVLSMNAKDPEAQTASFLSSGEGLEDYCTWGWKRQSPIISENSAFSCQVLVCWAHALGPPDIADKKSFAAIFKEREYISIHFCRFFASNIGKKPKLKTFLGGGVQAFGNWKQQRVVLWDLGASITRNKFQIAGGERKPIVFKCPSSPHSG